MMKIRVLTKEESDFDKGFLNICIQMLQEIFSNYHYPSGSKLKRKMSVQAYRKLWREAGYLYSQLRFCYLKLTGRVFDYEIKKSWIYQL